VYLGENALSNDVSGYDCFIHTRVIPKVSGLDILDNNIIHNLYISKTYILYEHLIRVDCGYDVIVIYDITED